MAEHGTYRVQRRGIGGDIKDDVPFRTWHEARDHLAGVFAEEIDASSGEGGCGHCCAAAVEAQARLSALSPGQDLADVDIDGSDYRLVWTPSEARRG